MPAAPPPTYNSKGMLQVDWHVVAAYHAAKDVLSLSWSKPGDLWVKAQVGALAYPVEDLQDLVEGTVTQVNLLGAPRLW